MFNSSCQGFVQYEGYPSLVKMVKVMQGRYHVYVDTVKGVN